jgi:hypothetical protein
MADIQLTNTFWPGGGSWSNGLGTLLLTFPPGGVIASGSGRVDLGVIREAGPFYAVTIDLGASFSGDGAVQIDPGAVSGPGGQWTGLASTVPPGGSSFTFSFDRGYSGAELSGASFQFTFTRVNSWTAQGVMTISHFAQQLAGVSASDDPGSGGQAPPDLPVLSVVASPGPPYSPGQPITITCDPRSPGGVYFPYTTFTLEVLGGIATFPNGQASVYITNGDTGPLATTTLTLGPTYYGTVVVRVYSTASGLQG